MRRRRNPNEVLRREELQINGERIVILRKPIRNIYLRVRVPDAHIEVTCPPKTSLRQIRMIIAQKRAWLDQSQQRVRAEVTSGEVSGSRRDFLDKWTPERRAQASATMNAWLADLLPKWTEVVGKTPTSITFRPMRTRWGSCTPSTGRIRLNMELAELPVSSFEYVMVHELTHLHVHGHGPEFQRRMTLYLPDWKTRRRKLNQQSIA